MALEPYRLAPPQPYREISDYNLIGDGRTSALVAIDGAIDWCCLPHFDSRAVLSRLADAAQGGYFAVVDAETELPPQPIRQRYIPSTAILQTEVHGYAGRLLMTDFMPTEHLRGHVSPEPPPRIVRRIEALDGRCRLTVNFKVSPDYGRAAPQLTLSEEGVLATTPGVAGVTLLSFADAQPNGQIRAVDGVLVQSEHLLKAHDRLTIVLGWAPDVVQGRQSLRAFRRDWTYELEATRSFWQDWSAQITYHGPYRQNVVRSAITLKLLTNAPATPLLAPLATALPEHQHAPLAVSSAQSPPPLAAAILERSISDLRASHDVRAHHRQLVLRQLREHGVGTRAALAKLLHLSRTTIGTIVAELVEKHLVQEGELQQPAASGGRRAMRITFQPQAAIVLGISLSARKLTVAVADLSGQTCTWQSMDLADSLPLEPTLLAMLDALVAQAGYDWEHVEGIGLAASEAATITALHDALQQRLPGPIASATPLLLGIYGEQRFGLGQTMGGPVTYVQLRPQLGLRTMRPGDDRPGEWLTAWDLFTERDADMVARLQEEDVLDDVPAALLAAQPLALELLDRLIQALISQIQMFHPLAVVLDGDDRALIAECLPLIQQRLQSGDFASSTIPLLVSQVEPGAIIRGAIGLALDGVFGLPERR